MFISQLISKVEEYDKYGEHRINGLKAVFVTELLFIVNFFYAIPNPYFYYFYVPLTAFAAEIAGNTIKDKFLFYFYTVMGSILAIFLFGMLQPYKLLFVIFVFFYGLLLYSFALYKIKSMFIPAPLILSLAIYSLLYGSSNTNFYIALNHGLIILLAMLVVMTGLLFFSRKYYLWIWWKAYVLLLKFLLDNLQQINQNQHAKIIIAQPIYIMKKYHKMLNTKMPIFSISKITLLSFDMVMSLSYILEFRTVMRQQYLVIYEDLIVKLYQSAQQKVALDITGYDTNDLTATHELRNIYHLIKSWNYLCSQKF